jgi:hypothetical protein
MPTREELRTFYLTGRGLDAFRPSVPLRPALLDRLPPPRLEQNYPLHFTDSEAPLPLFLRFPGGDSAEVIAGVFAEHCATNELTAVAPIRESALEAARARLEMLNIPSPPVQEPVDGWLIPFGEATLRLLSSAILERARRGARVAFARELKDCEQRLRDRLAVEDRRSRPAAASLGARAANFLNTAALSAALRGRADATMPMQPERRARCEAALEILQGCLREVERQPAVLVVGLAGGAELCRRQLDGHTAALKALRVARWEAVDAEALDTFDWTLGAPGEIAALPVVLVVATAHEIQGSLAVFAELLQSGLPIQILIPSVNPLEDLGCLPVAYQEAFVLHSSLACVDHLIAGLSEMAQTLRPAVAVVSVADSWTETALVPLARACPLYRYHPDLGETWHERFALQPVETEGLTFAHVAATMPAFQEHFRVLPEGWEPVDLALPTLPVPEGQAIYTRELAKACAAVESRWRLLCGLAAPPRPVVVNEVQPADPRAEDRARLDGAAQAIHRVISILTNA